MRVSITSASRGNIEFWNDDSKSGASAVFEVMIDYETVDGAGQEKGKLVIDSMDFAEPPWDAQGNLHGRSIMVEPVDEDDMHGSIYFLATHTPVHVKALTVENHVEEGIVQVKMMYRLLFDQSGLADDVDADLKADLEIVGG